MYGEYLASSVGLGVPPPAPRIISTVSARYQGTLDSSALTFRHNILTSKCQGGTAIKERGAPTSEVEVVHQPTNEVHQPNNSAHQPTSDVHPTTIVIVHKRKRVRGDRTADYKKTREKRAADKKRLENVGLLEEKLQAAEASERKLQDENAQLKAQLLQLLRLNDKGSFV